MTDEDIADVVYIEPLTVEVVDAIIAARAAGRPAADARRADRPQPRRRSWPRPGILEQYNVRLLGTPLAIDPDRPKTASCSSELLREIGEPVPTARSSPRSRRRDAFAERRRPAAGHPARLHARRHRRRHRAHRRTSCERIVAQRPRRQPDRARSWSSARCSAGKRSSTR